MYKESPNFNVYRAEIEDKTSSILKSFHNWMSRNASIEMKDTRHGLEIVDFDITHDLPWVAKDVARDSATFVVEIPTASSAKQSISDASINDAPLNGKKTATAVGSTRNIQDSVTTVDLDSPDAESLDNSIDMNGFGELPSFDYGADGAVKDDDINNGFHSHDLSRELAYARKNGKPLRIYFRCEKGSVEKALWLRALDTFGRLSSEFRRQRGIRNAIMAPLQLGSNRARIRSQESAFLARDTRNLDLTENAEDAPEIDNNSVDMLVFGPQETHNREFRVVPDYAYPHRWMTVKEMRQEMLLTSEHFHDLRVPGCKQKEIGSLRVEVLQCLGLPKLNRTSDTDGVVYLVCGEYSFCTDVIPNRQNPMWLRKSRRACDFPLFHGYANLYVGVFGYEPRKAKDDFAGRVQLNLSKLRPGSIYDIILPLRLSVHVYSRRKRGAIRLRFCLTYASQRDAVLSYIPRKINIPLPQNSTPNYDVSVRCTDARAFRNIAITVHGAHLPSRFTFVQMRAAIREINFTRKYILTAIRQTISDLRQWRCPTMSAYAFLSWMHCIYMNQFSLVPAYVVLYCLINLMCNYVRYNTDEPVQCGFIPPSWEELFAALLWGSDNGYRAIQPLELTINKFTRRKRRAAQLVNDKNSNFKASTHVPLGKDLMRALGLVSKSKSAEEEHLEFPFSNGLSYPKFGVKDCLVQHRKCDSDTFHESTDYVLQGRERSGSHDSVNNPLSRFSLDMDLQNVMRRDSSGTKEFDEEEKNFIAARAVIARGKKAKAKISKTASALGDKYFVNPLHSRIDLGVSHVNYLSNHMAQSTRQPASTSFAESLARRTSLNNIHGRTSSTKIDALNLEHSSFIFRKEGHATTLEELQSNMNRVPSTLSVSCDFDGTGDASEDEYRLDDQDTIEHMEMFPDQDIDFEGPNNGKKLTDDLAEIKDKMHEMTWHLFDDHAYVVKNSNAIYFGDGKKPEKKRKADVRKQLDKYLGLGQYSYSNPFVARVGMYVEPIIGSAYSFLCLFRAGFNIVTWRDPILTFWVSLFSGILVVVLFIFPWRIFLAFLGIFLVGPQNLIIRIMRERGHLPAATEYQIQNRKHQFTEEITEWPTDVPVFTVDDLRPGNEPFRNLKPDVDDPREIHHVPVPYSPLIYQRCYDWPPETQYARVTRENFFSEKKKGLKWDVTKNSTNSSNSAQTQSKRPGLRNRFIRLPSEIDTMSTRSAAASTIT